jgi:hypothetical protein
VLIDNLSLNIPISFKAVNKKFVSRVV